MKFMNREYILKFITRLYEILIPVLKYFCFSPRRIVKPQVTHIKNKNTSSCTTFIRFYIFYNQKRDLLQETFYVIQIIIHSHTLNMVDSQGLLKGRCYAISLIVKHTIGGGIMVFFFKQDHNYRF